MREYAAPFSDGNHSPATKRNLGSRFRLTEGVYMKIIAWVLGVCMWGSAFTSLFEAKWLGGITFLVCGAVLLPPIADRFRFLKAQGYGYRIGCAFIILIVMAALGGMSDEHIKAQAIEQRRLEFVAVKATVMADLQQAYDAGNYAKAKGLASPYLDLQDPDLNQKYQEVVKAEQQAEIAKKRENFKHQREALIASMKKAIAAGDYSAAVNASSPFVDVADKDFLRLREDAKKKVADKQEAEHLAAEKAAGSAQAAAVSAQAVGDVRGYEAFLEQAEIDFKATPASQADLEAIRKATTLFSALAEAINQARQSASGLSREDAAYVKRIEGRLVALQQRTLPGLRKAFAAKSARLLWESDLYVTVGGDANTVITFSGGMFAANANIQAFQDGLDEIITKLRFKQTRFKWFKGADEYTYYKLTTPADGKIAMFKFGRFEEIAAWPTRKP